MKTLLCIGAVLGLCGTACAEGLFDPFSGIIEGVAQELASMELGSPPSSAITFDEAIRLQLQLPSVHVDRNEAYGTDGPKVISVESVRGIIAEEFVHVPVMPDNTLNAVQEAEESVPILIMQGSSKADDAPETVPGVNLVSPADAD